MISFEAMIRACDPPVLEWCDNPDHRGLKPVGLQLPVSISEVEAQYLFDFIIAHQLKSGLDLATGTGVSAAVMALAMFTTNGGVLTIDSNEEEVQQQQTLSRSEPLKATQSWPLFRPGNAVRLWQAMSVPARILPVNDRWPECCTRHAVLDADRGRHFDVVMLDCPKCDDDLGQDLWCVRDRLVRRRRWAVFIHDTHVMPRAAELVKETLGVELVNVLPGQKYPFMLATNIAGVM